MLDGNSPRFPWEPSTTMLISRHTGTTDDSVSDRSAHGRFSPGPAAHATGAATVSRTPIFVPPRRVPEGPWVADMAAVLRLLGSAIQGRAGKRRTDRSIESSTITARPPCGSRRSQPHPGLRRRRSAAE